MTDDDRDWLAAEFVLGVLDPQQASAVEQALAEDAELSARVAFWRERLAGLDSDLPPITPPKRVWENIERALDAQASGSAAAEFVVRKDARQWRPLIPGVDWLILHRDPATGCQSVLLRFAPGSRFPPHRHTQAEECILLEGDLQIGRDTYRAGDYVVMPANTVHPIISSSLGAIAYIRGEIRDTGS